MFVHNRRSEGKALLVRMLFFLERCVFYLSNPANAHFLTFARFHYTSTGGAADVGCPLHTKPNTGTAMVSVAFIVITIMIRF